MSFLQSRTRSAREGIGKPVLRKEDARLLVGGGCYSDDVNLPGQAYACFVRSPHAHARIGRIDAAGALATPGVIAVLTGEDAAADGVKPLTHSPMPGNPHEEIVRGTDVSFVAPHPPIPVDRVRFAGEVVAVVIAETPAAARDGAERVGVDWSPLPAVTASLAAAAPAAPILYDGTASNVCVDAQAGDSAAVERVGDIKPVWGIHLTGPVRAGSAPGAVHWRAIQARRAPARVGRCGDTARGRLATMRFWYRIVLASMRVIHRIVPSLASRRIGGTGRKHAKTEDSHAVGERERQSVLIAIADSRQMRRRRAIRTDGVVPTGAPDPLVGLVCVAHDHGLRSVR